MDTPSIADKPLHGLEPPRLDDISREELLAYFTRTWRLYDWLFESLTGRNALYVQPDRLRHPLVFYLGHTAVFYINKLRMSGLVERGLNDAYEELFAVGVDPERPEDLDGAIDWPAEPAVRDYRRQVFDFVTDFISRIEIRSPVTEDDPLWSLFMGLEHDRVHFETSSVLIRQYDESLVTAPEGWHRAPANVAGVEHAMIAFGPGRVELGKRRDLPTFGWDSDYGRRVVDVGSFEVARNLVSNGEYLQFLQDGGYTDERLWSEEGREWKRLGEAAAPRFWVREGGRYRYRAMFDVVEMPLDWPAEVNAHEAAAYCRWLGDGYRLLTEAEYVRLASETWPRDGDVMFGNDYNMNLRFGSPCPVGMIESARSRSGVNDVHGNVWTWLGDDFAPLPGYRTHPLYADWSKPYFDNKHAVLRGGCWASSGSSASQYYRNWFRRHFVQHAGFRVARDVRAD